MPCFIVGIDRKFGAVLRNMYYPYFLASVIGDKFFHVKSFCREIGTAFCQSQCRFLTIIIISVGSDDPQRVVLYIYHKMSTLHIRDGRDIRDDIVFLISTKRVLQVLELFPFAPRILLRIFAKKILLQFLFEHISY